MRSGKTGTGKTFDAVKLVYKFWRSGMDIYSNTPLFFTKFANGRGGENIEENPKYFTIFEKISFIIAFKLPSLLFKIKYRPIRRGTINYFDTLEETFYLKDAVIFFDEGQTAFRNYDWESIPRLFLYKLEQNRKHGLHLITTAQRVKAVNINYRELIQDWAHFETIIDLFGFHVYRKKQKDVDYITDDMHEQDIPNLNTGLLGFKIILPFTKRLYDTFYDIGFEPLQNYVIDYGDSEVDLIIESGMTVKQAIQNIRTYSSAKLLLLDKKYERKRTDNY